MKQLYIIAGCNGAGKTTTSYTVLPKILDCEEFVNADEIARGLSPFNPESNSIQAGRLMLKRIDSLLAEGKTFAFETTLSTRSFINFVNKAQDKGYNVTLLFLWLNSENLAVKRVQTRVKEGGHHIPEDVIRRRYQKGLSNFFTLYSTKVDKWLIVDNSGDHYVQIAEGIGSSLKIYDSNIWNEIKSFYEG